MSRNEKMETTAMQSSVLEWCREDLPDGERCHVPAKFILWGKLFPPEALGPRCYAHAAEHAGHRALGDPAWAIFDLRKVTLATTEGVASRKDNA